MNARTHTLLLVILGAVFALLLLYGFPDSSTPWFDEGINLNLARTFAEKGVLNLETAPGEFVNEKPLLITTNYPALLPIALFFKAFGVGLAQAKFVMLCFLVAFAALAYRLVQKLYGKESALYAFALLVTFLPLYGNGKSVLGEVPGLVFFLGGLLLLHKEKKWQLVLAGVLFGLAAATKSSFLIMLGAVAAGEFYFMWARREFAFNRALLLSLGASIPLFVWVWTLIPDEASTGLVQNVFDYYRNPYASEGTVIPNLVRFFTESTPLHYSLLFSGFLIAVARKRLRALQREEVVLFAFTLFNLVFYLTTVGWYRYFFPSHLLLLIVFPGAVFFLFQNQYLRAMLLSALLLVQTGVLVVNIHNPLYHDSVPREFGAASSRLIGDREVVTVDAPEIAFFIASRERHLYLRANPRFVFGDEPFADNHRPRFIITGTWLEHPYLGAHMAESGEYSLALLRGRYHLYELSH